MLRPENWRWSSSRAQLEGIDEGLISRGTLVELVADWRAYLDDTPPSWQADRIRRHVRTGRPLGDEKLLAAAEKATGRALRRKQAGGESARQERGKSKKGRYPPALSLRSLGIFRADLAVADPASH